MNHDKINIIYTAEDIEQYFSGKLLPAQMYAMEKAALDDLLLSEAMEGYEGMKKADWGKQLAEARENIKYKSTEAKVVPLVPAFKWWKVAAAMVIIAGGAGLIYQLNNKSTQQNKTNNIATLKNENTDTINTIVIIPDAEKTVAPSGKITDNAVVEKEKIKSNYDSTIAFEPPKRNRVEVLQNQENIVTANERSTYPEKKAPATLSAPTQNASTQQSAVEIETDKTVAKNYDAMANRKEAALNRVFVAEVIGADKMPLPFARINIPAENVGTYTDVNGKFRLVGVDSILNIEVRAAGFASRNFNISSNAAKNTLILNEVSFDAKDIVELKSKANKSNVANRKAMQFDTVLNVEPVDGWSNYDTYLNNNITLPSEVLQKNIHGDVEVSFDLQKNGKMSNVNISKSLCGNCDAEALRVIKEGPQWKVKKGKKEKGKVKVKF